MTARISLPPQVTLKSVSTLHATFCEAFEADQDVELDAGDLEHGDLSVIQLILAARVQALRGDGQFRLAAPANAALGELLARSGLTPQTPSDIDFWFHGDTPA